MGNEADSAGEDVTLETLRRLEEELMGKRILEKEAEELKTRIRLEKEAQELRAKIRALKQERGESDTHLSHLQPQPYQESRTPEKISRRKFCRNFAGFLLGAAAAAAGAEFLLSLNTPEQSDPQLYSGTIAIKTKGDSKGNQFYYTDICHTGDETNPSQYPVVFLNIGLNRDKNPACHPTDGILSSDFAYFGMVVGKSYEVKNWGGRFPAEEIFDRCKLGKKATFRKGEQLGNKGYFLDRVESM